MPVMSIIIFAVQATRNKMRNMYVRNSSHNKEPNAAVGKCNGTFWAVCCSFVAQCTHNHFRCW